LRRKGRIDGAAPRTVLIVDDEADILELLELTLLRMGLEVERASGVKEALERLQSRTYDLCLTDMRLPDGTGIDIVKHISQHCTDLPVAVITAHGNTENAVAALKAGAFDYVAKPVSLEQLRTLVKSALSLPQVSNAKSAEGHSLLGDSQAIQQVRAIVEKLGRSEAPVYISGESGSGKELAARLIHEKSARREKPFVPVNCGAIPETLMESEFFGYKRGAFTGADQDRDGFFQAASGGTLFLDEVADLPLLMQVKLLRAIQEKKVRKVGSTQEDPADVRIISATHKSLSDLVEGGKFRHDLYYRLAVIELRMPPLREMMEDIPLLTDAVLQKLARSQNRTGVQIDPQAMAALVRYDFPGNVRELENILERALALCSDALIQLEDLQLTPSAELLKEEDAAMPPATTGGGASGGKVPLQEYLDTVEKAAILEALEKTRYNRTAAAKLLGITFRALRYRMERLGIQ
jgi:two-component system response regulator PilR (NtrC family)